MLADALYESRRSIERINLPYTDPVLFRDTLSTKHTITGLTTLVLHSDYDHVNFLQLENPRPMPALLSLIKCLRPTLQALTLRCSKHLQLPERGEHTFTYLLSEPNEEFECDPVPLVFPSLQTLELSSLIVPVPSFLAFVTQQPNLHILCLEHVHIGTPGYTWESIAAQLTPFLTKLYLTSCRHKPFHGFERPVRYNWIDPYMPYQTPFDESACWRLKDPFDKDRNDERSWLNRFSRHFLEMNEEQRRSALNQQFKMNLNTAAYERLTLS
ncbi:hypothetical protein BDV96DRAFT_150587 [Lophiotrema nucula]|uniref:F-box domain-containing protein n=1 Tax=Lophiotrema nucula TaxID=690887 RepID=A0A6A5Z1Y6_9PLEO|nr:hypothetical protein BDV96DRAFT_150587 [Lophiotrema nucula]